MFRRLAVVVMVAAVVGPWAAGSGARAAGPTNDWFWDHEPTQWGLLQAGAPQAWTVSTGAGITIGVVDSGVDAAHPDLAGKVIATANCIGAAGNPAACQPGGAQDDNGHGTHVSGIAAAVTGNGIGVAGMAPDAKLVVAEAVAANGAGKDADVAAGIAWVVSRGAQVVNLSLARDATNSVRLGSASSIAIEDAWRQGVVPVIAAGNDSTAVDYGALDAMVVAATGPNGQLAPYSDQISQAKFGLAAPGGAGDGNPDDDIVSTWPGGQYATIAGTSMATPHVAGAVALLLAHGYDGPGAVQRILTTATVCAGCGHGRLDVAAALGAGAAAPPAPSPTPSPASRTAPPGTPTVVGPTNVNTGVRAPASVSKKTPSTTPALVPPSSAPPAPPSTGAPTSTTSLDARLPSSLALAAPARTAEPPAQSEGRVPAVAAAIILLALAGSSLTFRRMRTAPPS